MVNYYTQKVPVLVIETNFFKIQVLVQFTGIRFSFPYSSLQGGFLKNNSATFL